jgi:uncharacterized DUF497 family protein
VTFEFDPEKSTANKAKHGIDFEEAQKLWSGKTVSVTLPFPGEHRRLVIGRVAGKHWAAIVTDRSSGIRLISVRRARRKEKEVYDQTS